MHTILPFCEASAVTVPVVGSTFTNCPLLSLRSLCSVVGAAYATQARAKMTRDAKHFILDLAK